MVSGHSLLSNLVITFVARSRPSGPVPHLPAEKLRLLHDALPGYLWPKYNWHAAKSVVQPSPKFVPVGPQVHSSRDLSPLFVFCLFLQRIFTKALHLLLMTLMAGCLAQDDQGWVLSPSEKRKKTGTVECWRLLRGHPSLRPPYLDSSRSGETALFYPQEYSLLP